MAHLDKIIYNLKNLPGKGSHTDDQGPGTRQMEFIVNHFRSELAAQRVNNNKSTDGFYQSLDNVTMIATKDFRTQNRDASVLRSKVQLPSMVSGHNRGFVIDFIGLRDEFLGFHKSTVHTFNIDLENPYVRNLYFISDDYLYVVTKTRRMLREVYVKAVFSDPRQALVFMDKADALTGYNWEYPIPGNLIGSLNNMVINNEFRWTEVLKSDDVNDGNDAE